jgi:hypothetical protein
MALVKRFRSAIRRGHDLLSVHLRKIITLDPAETREILAADEAQLTIAYPAPAPRGAEIAEDRARAFCYGPLPLRPVFELYPPTVERRLHDPDLELLSKSTRVEKPLG